MTHDPLSSDYWYNRYMANQRAAKVLIAENARLRAALLSIKEHKLPYPGYSADYGSNGVRDHFIKIASEALDTMYS